MTHDTEISLDHILAFEDAKKRLELVKPKVFGLRPTLNEVEKNFLTDLCNNVQLGVVLSHIAADMYESVDTFNAGTDEHTSAVEKASVVSAAALFCKTWEPGK